MHLDRTLVNVLRPPEGRVASALLLLLLPFMIILLFISVVEIIFRVVAELLLSGVALCPTPTTTLTPTPGSAPVRATSATSRFFTFLAGIRLWSTLASRNNSSISPSSHSLRRLYKHLMRSFLFAFREGLWRRRCSIVATAVIAIRASGEFSVTALYNLALIRKNFLPEQPLGIG